MLFGDAIYLGSLVISIGLGGFYKGIEDGEARKSYGAGLGLLVACLCCREYFHHTLLMVLANIIIIKCCDKRYLHQTSLGFTFLYLLYIHFNLRPSLYTSWIFQGLALRLVGLSFELYLSEKAKSSDGGRKANASSTRVGPARPPDDQLTEPTATEVLTYAYFFVGIHKGPYYKMKVLNDYFEVSGPNLKDHRAVTIEKLKKISLCVAVYLLLIYKFPVDAYYTDEFYREHSSEYRFLYNIPSLAQYVLHQQILFALCTCVYTETGFGVDPNRGLSLPATRSSSFKLNTGESVITEDICMMTCFDNAKLVRGPMMKDSLRGWDMPTQHWFWGYIYKSLIKSNREVRSACSFLSWCVWCGPTVAQAILCITLWIYVHLESEYNSIYNTTDSMQVAWNIGYCIMRVMCLVYLSPCLLLSNCETVFRYYSSVYWAFHLLLLLLLAVAVIAFKIRDS